MNVKNSTTISNSTVVEECNSFRITYPTKTNLKWTDNTCYKIKYQVNNSRPDDAKIYVSLMNAEGEYVGTLVNGAETSKTSKSIPFNLYLGAHPLDGDYYLSVKFSNGMECAAKNTPLIHVTHKVNSTYPKCH
ncbi:hypothetical protein K501DRAFT_260415 [Backusella circina FSU 941]|nr:hypothetical protein K501DRAFT_260415 [Backusella circina FSU 941]